MDLPKTTVYELSRHINREDEIISAGYDPDTVADILRKVNLSEYKRLQAAPGLKVTSKAFGSGRRVPVAKKYI
jgi:NAD+ synthase (glutamine-hydrolysing)